MTSFVVQITGTGLGLLAHWVCKRFVGLEQYGIWVFALSVVAVLVVVARVGMQITCVRFAAAYGSSGRFGELNGLARFGFGLVAAVSVAIAAVGLAVVFGTADLFGLDEVVKQTALASALLLPIFAVTVIPVSFLIGFGRVGSSQAPEAIVRWTAFSGVCFLFWLTGVDMLAPGAMMLHVATSTLAFFLAMALALRELPRGFFSSAPIFESDRWWRTAVPLWVVSGMAVIYRRLPTIIAGMVIGPAQVGIYYIANQLATLLGYGLMASNRAALGAMSSAHDRGHAGDLQKATSASALLGLASTTALFLGLLVAAPIALKLFGPLFTEALPVVWILAGAGLIGCLLGPAGSVLTMTGNERALARLQAGFVPVQLIASWYGCVAWGLFGLAATVSGIALIRTTTVWFIAKRLTGVDASVFSALKAR